MDRDKKFYIEDSIKVHTYDTDYMGIVSNTVYPKYFEDLRCAVLDKYFPLEDMMREHNTPILSETHIFYKRHLTLNTNPVGRINIILTGPGRWEADIEIADEEYVYCTAHQVGYYFNMDSHRPVRFPKEFLEYYDNI